MEKFLQDITFPPQPYSHQHILCIEEKHITEIQAQKISNNEEWRPEILRGNITCASSFLFFPPTNMLLDIVAETSI